MLKRRACRLAGLLAACAAAFAADATDASQLQGKVLLGYQGWFNCPLPGVTGATWSHWSKALPSPDSIAVDLYPDLSEFAPDELCQIPGETIAGKPAYLFSAWSRKTVQRHFEWMRDYGLDGVLVQRFVTDIPGRRNSGDIVVKNIVAAAAATGRVFAVEYDITGADPARLEDILESDWRYLVDDLKITQQSGYLRHNGKPLVSVWGAGFTHVTTTPEITSRVVRWFQTDAPVRYRAAYMGGVPSRWRTANNDAKPDPAWSEVYAHMDVIQPWTVGRYKDEPTAARWKTDMLDPDLAESRRRGQLYMPVIFPGFSWHNLNRQSPENQIPRNGGEFLWGQAYRAKLAGADVLKIAMFDEVNEGTAVFKAAPSRIAAPEPGYWLTLDADGKPLPSDWYLRIAGAITRMFHGQLAPTPKLPPLPAPAARN